MFSYLEQNLEYKDVIENKFSEGTSYKCKFDWVESNDLTQDVEMVKSSSDCSFSSASQYVFAGQIYTVIHGNRSCCDADARLRYYNGFSWI